MITDSVPLMHQLSRMANLGEAPVRKMVLVLEVSEPPKLYTEGYIDSEEELSSTELEVHPDECYEITTEVLL